MSHQQIVHPGYNKMPICQHFRVKRQWNLMNNYSGGFRLFVERTEYLAAQADDSHAVPVIDYRMKVENLLAFKQITTSYLSFDEKLSQTQYFLYYVNKIRYK